MMLPYLNKILKSCINFDISAFIFAKCLSKICCFVRMENAADSVGLMRNLNFVNGYRL